MQPFSEAAAPRLAWLLSEVQTSQRAIAFAPQADLHDRHAAEAAQSIAIMLRFPIRAEHLGKLNKDPVHFSKNLELLDGTPVPPDDIEVLLHGRWMSIVDPGFLKAYREMFRL